MNKNIQPVNVPVTSKVSLAEVDDLIHNVDDPSFAEKNNLTYQGIMRNPHIDKGFGWITTTGRKLTVDNDILGNGYIKEDNGNKHYISFTKVLKDTIKVPTSKGGDLISAAIYNDILYAVYESESTFNINAYNLSDLSLIYSKDLKEVIEKKTSIIVNAVIGSTDLASKGEIIPKVFITTEESAFQGNILYELDVNNINNTSNNIKRYNLNVKVGKKMYASSTPDESIIGYEDNDQRKRFTFFLKDGNIHSKIKYFGTVNVEGQSTGEPIPYIKDVSNNTYIDIETLENEDGSIIWLLGETVSSSALQSNKSYEVGLMLGYYGLNSPITVPCYTFTKDPSSMGYYNTFISVDFSTNDDSGTSEFLSNVPKNKGIYYDWGEGWAKTYCRVATPSVHKVKANIYTYTNDTYRGVIKENLFFSENAQTYTPGHISERCYSIGGNNIGENSILDVIPFTVKNNDTFDICSQIYGLQRTSISIGNTLLTTPSEGISKSKSIFNIQNQRSGLDEKPEFSIFLGDEIYIIKNTDDITDINISKIADYYFKTNALDGLNLIFEERNGNLHFDTSFNPYNMSFRINNNTKLTVPDENVKEANDTWVEAAGSNVNLEVDNPSFSFFLPKIILPIYISSEDVRLENLVKKSEKNIILTPSLDYLSNRKIDVYYTLQSVSTDCSYKYSVQVPDNPNSSTHALSDLHYFFDNNLKNNTWWVEETGTVLFPIGIGSNIKGINYITPSVQLPNNYSCRLYTNANRLFMGFDYQNQIWNGATIFTIYGSNFYYDGQAIYFIGSDQDYTANNFVTYALGMKFLANSGSEAYFYSDFEKRLFIFSGSNTLSGAEYLSNIKGTIVDAVFSSKEQALYILTSEGEVIVRTQNDLCMIKNMNTKGHLEGTTEGCAFVEPSTDLLDCKYQVFSPWKGDDVLPFTLKTEHFGAPDFLSKLAYADILIYKNEDENPIINLTCQTLNGIEKVDEKVLIKINKNDWHGNTYRIRFTPNLNVGNAFDIGIYSEDKIGVQNICFYLEGISPGAGDHWQDNVVNILSAPSMSL